MKCSFVSLRVLGAALFAALALVAVSAMPAAATDDPVPAPTATPVAPPSDDDCDEDDDGDCDEQDSQPAPAPVPGAPVPAPDGNRVVPGQISPPAGHTVPSRTNGKRTPVRSTRRSSRRRSVRSVVAGVRTVAQTMPRGGIQAGAGGTAVSAPNPLPLLLGVDALILLAAGGGVLLRARLRDSRA
jgi:hypothetical protein